MSEAPDSEEMSSVGLGGLADITMGQSPDSSAVNSEEKGLPFLQGCAEFGNRTPDPVINCQPPLRIAQKDSVLISVRAPVGTLNWSDQRYCIGRGLGAVKGKANTADTRFLYYSLDQGQHFLHRRSQGSTFLAISSKDLQVFPIPRFGLPTQQKIARILKTVDRAMEKTEALIEKYQQIKAGLMHDLFTRGLWTQEELDRGDHQGTTAEATAKPGQLRPARKDAPQLYRETPVGWIPKAWNYELLDKLADRGSGHTPSKSHPEYWNGGIKWVSLSDSHRLDQLYIDETDYKISTLGLQNSSAVLHPVGVVVLSRDAGIGKSAITTKQMAVSQHFMCWKCDQKMNNHFLYYWLQANKRRFENIAMGSTILTIGLNYFKRLKIACPQDTVEQTAIADRLRAADENIFTLKTELQKKSEQKAGLMHDLLTGKVPVNPDT